MIKLLFMDVDGTLTDGSIIFSSSGDEYKIFDIKDGYGIHEILPAYGIIPVIITGRTSAMVEKRAEELGINELYQGVHDKVGTFLNIIKSYGCEKEDVAYIGDDILDKECMELAGIRGCPQNAVEEIKEICNYVCKKEGGKGAVREFIEWLVK